MAGAAKAKFTIALGPLIQFPVMAKAGTREEKIAFNLHHAGDCGGGIGQGVSICKLCGEDVDSSEIVRGYKGKPGVDNDYLKSLEFEKSTVIELDRLVDAVEIDPRQYQRSYSILAEKGGEKAYVLLLRLLEKHHKVGLGKVVMGGKEYIVTLRPKDGVLAMELMYWPSEVLGDEEAKLAIAGVDVSDAELGMGDQLVKFLSKPYEPELYENRLYLAQMEYLDSFLADETPAALPAAKAAPKPTDDLAAALQASLNALGAGAKQTVEEKKKPARRRKVA